MPADWSKKTDNKPPNDPLVILRHGIALSGSELSLGPKNHSAIYTGYI